jgi:hypothetical protein
MKQVAADVYSNHQVIADPPLMLSEFVAASSTASMVSFVALVL